MFFSSASDSIWSRVWVTWLHRRSFCTLNICSCKRVSLWDDPLVVNTSLRWPCRPALVPWVNILASSNEAFFQHKSPPSEEESTDTGYISCGRKKGWAAEVKCQMCLYVLFIYSAESLHLCRVGWRPWSSSAPLKLCVSVYKGSVMQGVEKK